MAASPIAPWRSPLARALHYHKEPHARYVQLATVSPQSLPHNRTVVFRGFLRDTDTLQFITDRRSAKVQDIKANPYGEVCWYFPKTREQFRIAGGLRLIDTADPDRTALWQAISAKARAQFFWAEPGAPRQAATEFIETWAGLDPPDNFCLLLLQPTTVDHLQLRGNPQNRTLYKWENNQWTVTDINP